MRRLNPAGLYAEALSRKNDEWRQKIRSGRRNMLSNIMQTGHFRDTYPYVRFGKGPEKIVIFPPLNDALFSVTQVAWYLYALFFPLARKYEIYAVSRKRHFPIGYTTREMAADYAAVFEELGPSHVLGVSLGGMIGQHFARDYPQHVRKLILLASGYRMGPEGLDYARRWIPWARRGLWKSIYEDTLDLSYRKTFRFGSNLLGPYILNMCRGIRSASDFIIAGQAGMIHNTASILPEIQTPTLIIGGTDDPLFPEPLFHEMKQTMPASRLLMIPGGKHGVFEENRRQCVREIFAHLDSPGLAGDTKS